MYRNIYFLLFILLMYFDSVIFSFDLVGLNVTLSKIIIFLFLILGLAKIIKNQKIIYLKDMKFFYIFTLVWIVFMILNTLWAFNTQFVIKGIVYYFYHVGLIFFITFIVRKMNFLSVMKSLSVLLFIVIFLGYLEYFDLLRFATSRYIFPEFYNYLDKFDINRVTGTFFNENDYSVLIGLLFPILLIGFLSKKFVIKISSILLMVASLNLVIINDARAVILMIVLEIIVLIVINNWGKMNIPIKSSLIIIFIVIFINYITSLLADVGSNVNKSVDIRLNIYKSLFSILYENNFLGMGTSNFLYISEYGFNFLGISRPHNWFLELIVEQGILIGALYIIGYVLILKRLYKIYINTKNKLCLFSFISLIGMIIGSLSPSSFYYYWPQWIIIGIGLAVIKEFSLVENYKKRR